MTAGFLSRPIMRPKHCWTILQVPVLAVLFLTLNADSEDSVCEVAIKVRRGTVHEASLGEHLRISCPVSFCNSSPPTVSWYKLEQHAVPVGVSSSSHIKTEWQILNPSEGISHLVFKNIVRSDSGEYHCQSGLIISHAIIISVYGDGEHSNVTQRMNTNSTVFHPEPTENLWLYVYTAAGILAFVVMVIIISVASMQGCKGKSKKETQTDNQYMVIPMVEQPLPHASLQASPRGSPSAPPSRRSTKRKSPPSQPNNLPLPRDNEQLYSKVKADRERQRNTMEEEGSSVVYAALNHQVPAGADARPWRPKEESSEYAAIRVKNH